MGAPSGALFARKNSPFTKPKPAGQGDIAGDTLPQLMRACLRNLGLNGKYMDIKYII